MNIYAIENVASSELSNASRTRYDGKGLDDSAVSCIAKAIAAAIEEYDKQKNGNQE